MKRAVHNQILALLFLFAGWTSLAATPAIIPLPQQMQVKPGVFTLCPSQGVNGAPGYASTKILADPSSLTTAQYLAELLFKSTGFRFQIVGDNSSAPVRNAILLTTANSLTNLGAEGYELTVAPDSVVVRAPASAGVFYGVQSMLQLLPPQIYAKKPIAGVAWTMSCVYIQDSPRFVWRGMMLDADRHVFTKDEVKQLIDGMALHKMNMLHIHLTDDQGWRVEVLKYPLLTQVGSWRDGINWTNNPRASLAYSADGHYGGFYTQTDLRELVAYALARHITIVPEIEMPGHSTAAATAYPQYFCDPTLPYDSDTLHNGPGVFCLARPETMPFLQDILTEMLDIFPSPYFHIGGDEVNFAYWGNHSLDQAMTNQLGISSWPKYQSIFTQQIANWMHDHGRQMVGWSEIENAGILTNAVCMDWQVGTGSKAAATASARQYVVMSPTSACYYNNYQYTNVTWSLEPMGQAGIISLSTAYNFDPIPSGLAAQYTNYILGAQGNLWSEYMPSFKIVEWRAYPRLCAMAELTWTAPNLKNYTNFTQRLATHQQRLAQMGVNYDSNTVTQIGTWTAAQTPAVYSTLDWDITTNVTTMGEIDVSFSYTTGANGLDIQWTALLENGVEIDRDTHAGYTGVTPVIPLFIVRLPARRPGATYTVRASVQGRGGTNSNGNVYLPAWN